MLVLSRRVGETLFIGNNIKVTVVGVNRGKIRLGIIADKSIVVLREELVLSDAKKKQK